MARQGRTRLPKNLPSRNIGLQDFLFEISVAYLKRFSHSFPPEIKWTLSLYLLPFLPLFVNDFSGGEAAGARRQI